MNKYGIIGLIILIAIVIGGAAYYMSIQQTKTVVPTTTTTFTSTSPVASTTTTTSGLTPVEIEAIKYMAEEEKLALDVYSKLAEMYPNVPVFANIAKSETTHVKAVLNLAEKYGIPINLGAPGQFNNTHIQELYNQLIKEGSKGLEEALKVGALIEETDIKDLQEWIAKVQHEDIKQVFECLMMGSRNHLRAFVSTLEKMFNTTYTPQVISQQEYEQIINSPMETGANNICSSLGINLGTNVTVTPKGRSTK